MNIRSILNAGLVLSALSLTACGGSSSSGNGNANFSPNHPQFYRNKVTQQASYYPTGDIVETMPKFSWRAIPNASEYHFGHEATNDPYQWLEYTTSASDAGCSNTGDMCEYTPSDYTFPYDIEKVWWVRAKVNEIWQDWSQPIVFTVVGGSQSDDIPTLIAPNGSINTTSPEFSWKRVNSATDYMLGYEDANTSKGWEQYKLTKTEAHCQTAQNCTYTPSSPNLSLGQNIAWWVRAKVNGTWQRWSKTSHFTIAHTQSERPFIMKVKSNQQVYTLRVDKAGASIRRNYNIDCDSDGILEGVNIINKVYVCQYSSEGEYVISLTGSYPHIIGAKNVVEIKQWGSQQWSSMQGSFGEYSSHKPLSITATDLPDLSNVTDTSGMFFGRIFDPNDTNQNISKWDVSNVNNMSGMFFGSTFNQSLNNWDVSNVTDMSRMFANAAFNQPLNNWDVSNVTSMQDMFRGSTFNQPIDSWDVSNVTKMSFIFLRSALSTDNYDKLLNAWSTLNLQSGVEFNATPIKYSQSAAAARDILINDFGWIIQDGGPL